MRPVQEGLFTGGSFEEGVAALRRDLLSADGPRISTMRNYNFAILPYPPEKELRLRQLIAELAGELRAARWQVLAVSLQRLLLDRLRALGDDYLTSLVAREKRLHARDGERALAYLKGKLTPHIEGPDGVAADIARLIDEQCEAHPDETDRTVVFIGRAGALYPFFHTSALLKHLDGRTRNLPVVLLYPGERRGPSALSFMGELPPDRDYRPRIYP